MSVFQKWQQLKFLRHFFCVFSLFVHLAIPILIEGGATKGIKSFLPQTDDSSREE